MAGCKWLLMFQLEVFSSARLDLRVVAATHYLQWNKWKDFCAFAWCLFYVPGLEISLVPVKQTVLTKRRMAGSWLQCGSHAANAACVFPDCSLGPGFCCPAPIAVRKDRAKLLQLLLLPDSLCGQSCPKGITLASCFNQTWVLVIESAVTLVRPGHICSLYLPSYLWPSPPGFVLIKKTVISYCVFSFPRSLWSHNF